MLRACASKHYFAEAVKASGAYPLLWTNGAHGSRSLHAEEVLDGWISGENGETSALGPLVPPTNIKSVAYALAHRLLATGW